MHISHQGMQVKPTMRHHFTPTMMTQDQKTENNKCWQTSAGIGTFLHRW